MSCHRILRHPVSTATALFLVLASATPARGQAGMLDNTFSGDGTVRTNVGGFDTAWDLTIDASGRVIVVGQASLNDAADFAVVRYTPSGTLDTTFGPNANGKVIVDFGFADLARAVAIDAQGRIVVVGESDEGGDIDWAVARLMPNGTLDTTFGANHAGLIRIGFGGDNDQATDVAIDSSGRIVVVGQQQDDIAGDADFGVIRLHSDGTVDTSFDGDGLVTIGFGDYDVAAAVAIDDVGRIVVGGSSFGANSSDFAAARLNDNGTVDGSFGSGGKVRADFMGLRDQAEGLVIDSFGRIVLGGFADIPGDFIDRRFAVARWLADGTPDNLFGSGGRVTSSPGFNPGFDTSEGFDVAVDHQGRLLLAGWLVEDMMVVARYDDLGQLDPAFGDLGRGWRFIDFDTSGDSIDTDAVAHGIAIDAQGRIVLAGVAADYETGERDFAVARSHSEPTADLRISKLVNTSTALPGDTVTFVLSVFNAGPSAAELVTVTDVLPLGLTFVSCSTTLASGVCGGTGNQRTVSYPLLPVGSASITLTATVDSGVADGTMLTNTASISSSTLDPKADNDSADASLTVRNRADLLLTQKVKKLTTRQLAYTLTVKNNGPYDARQLVLNNPMPNGTHFVAVQAGPWTCVALPPGSVGTLSCTLPSLPSGGATTATLTFDVKTTAPGSVDIINTASVSAATHDPNLGNNTARLVTRVSGK